MTAIDAHQIEQLRAQLAGDVLTDHSSRLMYAADASLYQQDPTLIVRPRNRADVVTAVEWAGLVKLPITARGTGTSLAGQTTGGGMILDLSRYFLTTDHVDLEQRTIAVEPGVIRDDLNDALVPTGWYFGPETATANRCTLGGMIANNSCGTHSPRYGTTREHTIAVDCVLADGSTAAFEPLDHDAFQAKLQLQSLEGQIYRNLNDLISQHRKIIIDGFPSADVTRRNTGYALDALAAMQPWHPEGRPLNLTPLICGSEGTLAIVTKATLNLVERPRHRLVIAAHFESVIAACEAAVLAVEHNCYAGELIDGTIIRACRQNREQARNAWWIQDQPGAILAIEMEDSDPQRVRQRTEALVAALQANNLGHYHPIIEASQIDDVWAVRKAGLGLLMGIPSADKAVAMIEDAAVAPRDLPAYVTALDQIMQRHGVDIVYYAHAAAGELHPRPQLDLRNPEHVTKFERICAEVADVVKQFGGSLSGEHGDGRVRSPFIKDVFEPAIIDLFKRVKQTFDPNNILNPGKIIDPLPLTTDLRTSPQTPEPTIDTKFDWSRSRGLVAATELCNGAGVCRKSIGRGTMCPSYHATREERHSTRGRANLFRRLLTSPNPQATFSNDDLKEALSLCLSCKACASECPANVDMARLKAEYHHQRHQRDGIPTSDQRFGRFVDSARRARLAPRLASWLANTGVVKRWLGVDIRRSMPSFARRTASAQLQTSAAATDPLGSVVLLIDEFSEYLDPDIAVDAHRVLSAAGWHVHAVHADCARSAISRGLLDDAQRLFEQLLTTLSPHIDAGHPIVGLEPSALLGLVDEAPDLVSEPHRAKAQAAQQLAVTFEQFVVAHADQHRWQLEARPQRILVHGHCHQKALIGTHSTIDALRLIPDATVEEIASGCCGMAGSFGYEHFDLATSIGEQILFPAVRAASASTTLCAPGTSCRHQIKDGTGRRAKHPAQIIAAALA